MGRPARAGLLRRPRARLDHPGCRRPTAQQAPLSETFSLHSNPGANLTILLDFDGAYVAGTVWNTEAGVTPATHPAWDPAGDGPAFNDTERRMVQQVWAMVAEDYAPFDVDVTTEDRGADALVRSSSGDSVYGTRVLITPSDDPFAKICDRGCGGVAYIDVFDAVGSPYQPAWVFPQAVGNDAKGVAEAAAHEAGHNLGLSHDGTAVQGYYGGQGVWAPIMGVGYDRPLVQWSQGSYPGADNTEDDLSILTRYLGLRADEAGSSPATPAVLPSGSALIGRTDDVDAYLLGACSAGAVVTVSPAAVAPNLDVRAVLYDATGAQRAVSQPPSGFGDGTTASGLGGSLTVPAAGDGWVLTVDGVGEGSWALGGYGDYGSLGAYTVGAPGCGQASTGVPGAPTSVVAAPAGTGALTLSWAPPASVGGGPVTGYVVSRSGSAGTETLPADARSHTFTGLTPATGYQLTVRAVNASGAGAPVTVSAATSGPAPAAPSAPRDVAGGYDQATGTIQAWWTEPASTGTQPISGYAVFLDGVSLGQLAPTERGVEITDADGFPAGPHVVGIAAVNAVGASPRLRGHRHRDAASPGAAGQRRGGFRSGDQRALRVGRRGQHLRHRVDERPGATQRVRRRRPLGLVLLDARRLRPGDHEHLRRRGRPGHHARRLHRSSWGAGGGGGQRRRCRPALPGRLRRGCGDAVPHRGRRLRRPRRDRAVRARLDAGGAAGAGRAGGRVGGRRGRGRAGVVVGGVRQRVTGHRLHRDGVARRCLLCDGRGADLHRARAGQRHGVHVHRGGDQRRG